jgi:hypothetical protein
MEDDKSPLNGSVSNWTHENLRAQSNVDKGRYFTVCMVLLALVLVCVVLLVLTPSITLCTLARYTNQLYAAP